MRKNNSKFSPEERERLIAKYRELLSSGIPTFRINPKELGANPYTVQKWIKKETPVKEKRHPYTKLVVEEERPTHDDDMITLSAKTFLRIIRDASKQNG